MDETRNGAQYEWIKGKHVTASFACVLLLGTPLVSCAEKSDDQPAASSEPTRESQAAPAEEEEPSACVGKKKGQQIVVVMGSRSADSPKKYEYTPDTLHLKAGQFVTIKLTNPSLQSHTFTIDSIDCDSGLVPPFGESVTVAFKVPKGTTPFYCSPHAEIPMNGEIVTK